SAHRTIFEHILAAYRAGEPYDQTAIECRLKVAGKLAEVESHLIFQPRSPVQVVHYAGTLRTLKEQRVMGQKWEAATAAFIAGDQGTAKRLIAELEQVAHPNEDYNLFTLEELSHDLLAPWLWHGIIREGKRFHVFGDSGVGKTFFSVDMALSAAT